MEGKWSDAADEDREPRRYNSQQRNRGRDQNQPQEKSYFSKERYPADNRNKNFNRTSEVRQKI